MATRPRRGRLLLTVAVLCCIPLMACGPELGPIKKLASIKAPTLPETSDPSVVRVGNNYHVYGSNNHLRAPITTLQDLNRVYPLAAKNAITVEGMPTKAPWARDARQHWAPSVAQYGSRWIMFFAADRMNPSDRNNPQCIGRAFASNPRGPFSPEAAPFYCGGVGGTRGALDPEVFTDPTGKRWLLMALGNTETPIHILRLDSNGGRWGDPVPILRRQHGWEYHFIEQPAMVYDHSQRNYVLAYSAGKWWEHRYSIGVARCAAPTGPCTSDPSGPMVASSNGRTGPGALSFFPDTKGNLMGIFATFRNNAEGTNGGRSASVMPFSAGPTIGLGDVSK